MSDFLHNAVCRDQASVAEQPQVGGVSSNVASSRTSASDQKMIDPADTDVRHSSLAPRPFSISHPAIKEISDTDARLVERFLATGDGQAFAALVQRHDRVVVGVCRRTLQNEVDREDVFQATFLVLAREARRVRKLPSLASWLYGVAFRLSMQVIRQQQRRREMPLEDEVTRTEEAVDCLARRQQWQILDEELNALPDKYRQPLVLKYLDDRSPGEMASLLGITIGAVEGLLKRGREALRVRLERRGIQAGVAFAALGTIASQAEAAPPALVSATIRAGLAWRAEGVWTELISSRAFELSGKEVTAMTSLTKAGIAAVLLVGCVALGITSSGLFAEGDGPKTVDGQAIAVGEGLVAGGEGQRNEPLSGTELRDPKLANGASAGNPFALSGDAAPLADSNNPRIGNAPAAEPPKETVVSGNLPKPNRAKLKGDGPGAWDMTTRTEKETRIISAFNEPTEVAFTDNSLEEALNFLEQQHDIEIWIDRKTLEESGEANHETPVTLSIAGSKLKSVLNTILKPLRLTYLIRDEMLVITTQEKAEELMETRVYDVSPLTASIPSKDLMELVMTVGTGAQWKDVDGQGGDIRSTASALIVRQNYHVHEQIIALLNQLDQHLDQLTEKPQPGELHRPSDLNVGGGGLGGAGPAPAQGGPAPPKPAPAGAPGLGGGGGGFFSVPCE